MIVVAGQLDDEGVFVYAFARQPGSALGSLRRATYLRGMGSHRLGRYQKASTLSSVPAPIHPRSCQERPSILWADRRHSRGAPRSCLLTSPRVRCSRPPVVRAWSRKHWQASEMQLPCSQAAVEHWHLYARGDLTCRPVQAARRKSRDLVGVRAVATCRLRRRCCVRLSRLVVALRLWSRRHTFVTRHSGDVVSPGYSL